METIIKLGYEKILKLFYENKSAKIHLRDIARKTKLNENSASRFLNMLEKQKILHAVKEANLKKYSLMNNDIVYSVIGYFDIIRFNALPSIRKNAALYFLEKLGEKPIICLIFGSTTKNTYNNSSDIDLLLITNRKIDTKKAENYADSQTAIKINSMQIIYNDFKEELKLKNDKVIQSAINTGYPLTNHIVYYRMVYNEGI